MKNILLVFCRETFQCSPNAIATYLGISVTEYQELESGGCLLTEEQAMQLGMLFNVKEKYIYEAALQLDLLLVKEEMVKIQKNKISQLREQLQELKSCRGIKKRPVA